MFKDKRLTKESHVARHIVDLKTNSCIRFSGSGKQTNAGD